MVSGNDFELGNEKSLLSESSLKVCVVAALEAISSAQTLEQLKLVKIAHVGDKSVLSQANRLIGSLDKTEKAVVGKLLGAARKDINDALHVRLVQLEKQRDDAILVEEAVDVTVAARRRLVGARHPLSLLQERVVDIFVGMGWEIAQGPELESEWFNFNALNFDEDHPARQMQDTFFVQPLSSRLVLRTHTSPVQIRAMLGRDLPIYVLCPGRVYRTDELDATHTPVFNQFEGLAVDKDLNMSHLRGTLEFFAKRMFGDEAKIRLRPNYFPFTEPSAELDVWHEKAQGGPRWVEWGGCGMVHPNVLRSVGVDPEQYSGFAFGMGMERTLQFRNGISDMRDIVEGDIRFGKHFGMEI